MNCGQYNGCKKRFHSSLDVVVEKGDFALSNESFLLDSPVKLTQLSHKHNPVDYLILPEQILVYKALLVPPDASSKAVYRKIGLR